MAAVWPAYFADPDVTPPVPDLRVSVETMEVIFAEVGTGRVWFETPGAVRAALRRLQAA
jgi:hypothetical protein